MRTRDIGQGWLATAHDDGTFSAEHAESGQVVVLTRAQAAEFVRLWHRAEDEVRASQLDEQLKTAAAVMARFRALCRN